MTFNVTTSINFNLRYKNKSKSNQKELEAIKLINSLISRPDSIQAQHD